MSYVSSIFFAVESSILCFQILLLIFVFVLKIFLVLIHHIIRVDFLLFEHQMLIFFLLRGEMEEAH